jgi:acetyl-CoA carboxylase biotin carboxyl carrier protein
MTGAEQITLFSRWLDGTDIELFELTTGQEVIRLRRDLGTRLASATVEAEPSPSTVSAPSVGVFRLAHPCGSAPLVQLGQRVDEGDPVGLMQVGALLVHVVAPHAGTVLEILAEDGSLVGYGAALVRLTKAGVL